jgi:hypothetical protein
LVNASAEVIRERRPKGFPELTHETYLDRRERPPYLGWLNDWSLQAARLAGGSNGREGIRTLSASAKMVRLSKAILDPRNDADRARLCAACAEFPGVGR